MSPSCTEYRLRWPPAEDAKHGVSEDMSSQEWDEPHSIMVLGKNLNAHHTIHTFIAACYGAIMTLVVCATVLQGVEWSN